MKIELKNQQFTADINVDKEWPMLWHTNEEGEQENDLSMKPCKIHLEFSGDVALDTGSLRITSCMNLMRAVERLDKIHAEKFRQKLCKEATA